MSTTFRRIKLGGGGFVTDIDISNDGTTRLLRDDVHGAYVWNATTSLWDQVVTAVSMPAGDNTLGNNDACVYDIRCCKTVPARIYMAYPGQSNFNSTIYRSDDRCQTWTKLTGFTAVLMTVASDPGRLFGPKMAVDPKNADHVIVGDSAGLLYRTTNGGTTWAQIGSIPTSALSDPAIVFDPSASLVSGRTGIVYIAWGAGTNRVYKSTDAGATFSQLVGGPDTVRRMACSSDGVLYATDNMAAADTNAWRYQSGSWTNLTTSAPSVGNCWHSVAPDPLNAGHVVLGAGAGNINRSDDYGANFYGYFNNAAIRVATDVPWLATTSENFMSNGDMAFDPIVSNKLWFAEGIGIWTTSPLTNANRPTWTSVTAGNEELIADDLIVPPGGKPLVTCQDRAIFYISDPNVYPSAHGVSMEVPIRHGWGIDYASSDPTCIVIVANGGAADKSSKSIDGGQTWTQFGSLPSSFGLGGCIAAATPLNFVWAPSQDDVPSYTTDGGANWTTCTFPGAATTPPTGWGFSQYQNRRVVCADRVNIGTFYALNYDAGIYRTTNGGANWSKVNNGLTGDQIGTGARLRSVPGKAGHVFWATGSTNPSDPHPYSAVGLFRSTDGCSNFTDITTAQEVWDVGFGMAAPGHSYPAIFIAGYANGDASAGIYQSDDNCVTWTRLCGCPFNSTDQIRAITGDMNEYCAVYFGLSGSGAGYGTIPFVPPTPSLIPSSGFPNLNPITTTTLRHRNFPVPSGYPHAKSSLVSPYGHRQNQRLGSTFRSGSPNAHRIGAGTKLPPRRRK